MNLGNVGYDELRNTSGLDVFGLKERIFFESRVK